ncbi:MAG: type II toxin-antitoxin system VapC family toxin [Symploca sp. SIO2B6]|nr:type II toxin-antitoxin system VapC family toxin [Symploca sp. SIO2B6]
MTLILDTNVLSELMNPKGSPTVKAWVAQQEQKALHITSITQAEILYGINILPEGKRRQSLLDAAHAMFAQEFAGKILAFNRTTAIHYAQIAAYRRTIGQPISQFDAQIAAICRDHSAAIATRNVNDFLHCDIQILNPWDKPEA